MKSSCVNTPMDMSGFGSKRENKSFDINKNVHEILPHNSHHTRHSQVEHSNIQNFHIYFLIYNFDFTFGFGRRCYS